MEPSANLKSGTARPGEQLELSYLGADRALIKYRLPLAEIATEFHDRVKTISSGYASVDYDEAGEQARRALVAPTDRPRRKSDMRAARI